MECRIINPEKTTVYKEIKSVTLPAFSGQMQVLPGHAETFFVLQKGDVIIVQAGGQKRVIPISIGGGRIAKNIITLIL